MRLRHALVFVFGLVLGLPAASSADPPAHAPAHGYRHKHKQHQRHVGGFELVLDSERGVHIVVGLPDVFFHEGAFYRRFDGRWQVSAKADGGWRVAVSGSVPHAISNAKRHPGPAKAKRHK